MRLAGQAGPEGGAALPSPAYVVTGLMHHMTWLGPWAHPIPAPEPSGDCALSLPTSTPSHTQKARVSRSLPILR